MKIFLLFHSLPSQAAQFTSRSNLTKKTTPAALAQVHHFQAFQRKAFPMQLWKPGNEVCFGEWQRAELLVRATLYHQQLGSLHLTTTLCLSPTHSITCYTTKKRCNRRQEAISIKAKALGPKVSQRSFASSCPVGLLASIVLVLLPASLLNASTALPFLQGIHTISHKDIKSFTYTRIRMLGGYQNVDTSDAYLTPHQREALQQFRAEQGSGFRFMVRQHWERLSGLKKRRGRVEGGSKTRQRERVRRIVFLQSAAID